MEILFSLYWLIIIILYVIPAFYWFSLTKKFNKKANHSFPPILYSFLYLIPFFGNSVISWNFIKDIRELQEDKKVSNPISTFKVYIIKMAIPYFLLLVGFGLGLFIGTLSSLLPEPLGFFSVIIIIISPFIPFAAFLWLRAGFKFLNKIIDGIPS